MAKEKKKSKLGRHLISISFFTVMGTFRNTTGKVSGKGTRECSGSELNFLWIITSGAHIQIGFASVMFQNKYCRCVVAGYGIKYPGQLIRNTFVFIIGQASHMVESYLRFRRNPLFLVR